MNTLAGFDRLGKVKVRYAPSFFKRDMSFIENINKNANRINKKMFLCNSNSSIWEEIAFMLKNHE